MGGVSARDRLERLTRIAADSSAEPDYWPMRNDASTAGERGAEKCLGDTRLGGDSRYSRVNFAVEYPVLSPCERLVPALARNCRAFQAAVGIHRFSFPGGYHAATRLIGDGR